MKKPKDDVNLALRMRISNLVYWYLWGWTTEKPKVRKTGKGKIVAGGQKLGHK